MAEAEKPETDPEQNRGGRPPHRPTIEQRQQVEQMKFCGEAEIIIARSLGIDVDTMRKHYEVELDDGHANRRREVIDLLFKSAREGNVSAQKKLEEMGRIAGAAAAINQRAKPRAEPKLGKKEEIQRQAGEVTGKFAPPAPPPAKLN